MHVASLLLVSCRRVCEERVPTGRRALIKLDTRAAACPETGSQTPQTNETMTANTARGVVQPEGRGRMLLFPYGCAESRSGYYRPAISAAAVSRDRNQKQSLFMSHCIGARGAETESGSGNLGAPDRFTLTAHRCSFSAPQLLELPSGIAPMNILRGVGRVTAKR